MLHRSTQPRRVSWCHNREWTPRFDAARHGYEAMPTSMGPGVLVVELGGDWNTTTVNELTVVPERRR